METNNITSLQTAKISELTSITAVTGNEYLLVSSNNNSYKIKLSDLLSTYITNITQDLAEGDEAISYVYTYFGFADNNVHNCTTFTVKNGKKGSIGDIGDTGKQGAQGAHGLLYQITEADELLSKITNKLDSDDETKVLSAYAGAKLADEVSGLKEIYLYSQDTMDTLISEKQYADNIKYFIYDEDDVEEDEIDDISAIKAETLA